MIEKNADRQMNKVKHSSEILEAECAMQEFNNETAKKNNHKCMCSLQL